MNNDAFFNDKPDSHTVQETELSCEKEPYLSHSLVYYLNDVKKQLQILNQQNTEESNYSVEQLTKIINPYEFIFTKLPNSKFSVSKLKPFSPLFYDLMEIINTLNLFDSLNNEEINTMHFGKNSQSSIDCINMMRENHNDCHYIYSSLQNLSSYSIKKNISFLYFEMFDQNTYTKWFLKTLIQILSLQKENGIAIIKVNDIYYKPIIDILFLLCNFYEKMYLIKPNSSNVMLSEKFIVCKKMLEQDEEMTTELVNNLQKRLIFLETNGSGSNQLFSTFINIEIPSFFINKLEEFNIITGQQHLNAMNQIINLMKMKNKEDKIENFKKINIQKCISWCEKYKIPCNKFNEKNNIFLPLIKIEKEEEEFVIEDEATFLL
jgi:predicted transcriptional regulator